MLPSMSTLLSQLGLQQQENGREQEPSETTSSSLETNRSEFSSSPTFMTTPECPQNSRTVSRTDSRTDGRTDSRTDGRTDSRTDGRTDSRTDDSRTDGRTNSFGGEGETYFHSHHGENPLRRQAWSDGEGEGDPEDDELGGAYELTRDQLDLPPADGLTENAARSYDTCHDARVALFFKAVRGLRGENLNRMCEASWSENPLDTLRIFFQARDCRGGKGERQLFLDFMTWLSGKSPENALVNLDLVPDYGRWLDLVQMASNSPLAEAVWVMLANQLRDDVQLMMDGKPISLCAKWIPTEGSKWDRELRATRNVARALGVNLKVLRCDYLTPLRAYLKIVERYMCERHWDAIDYNKVPSRAMLKLKKAFERNDPERFVEWKAALEAGRPEAKVNAKVLFPHELIRQYLVYGCSKDVVAEAQWQVLLEETQKLGSFGRSLAVCDVSGSMHGTPMEVAIALGIIVSRFCPEPYRGKVITFSAEPTFHDVRGNSLYDQVLSLSRAPWGMNTNFIKVFDMILNKAKEHGVPVENMPNRLYVFSDMQFDQASAGNYYTNYEEVQRRYVQAGYEVPQIVFWNLRGDTLDFPIGNARTPGVAMVSGFTTAILKALLNGRELSPITVLGDALDDERYCPIRYVH